MPTISREVVERICFNQHGLYSVPNNIVHAIESCVTAKCQDLILEEFHRISGIYKAYRKIMLPIKIEYSNELTHDAYSIFYLPRNILIPWLAFRDLSFNGHFTTFSNQLNILDLGSGTGAITLGLLHLLNSRQLQPIEIKILSVDYHPEQLKRQRQLIEIAGFNTNQVSFLPVDLNDFKTYVDKIDSYGPFEFIFCGNCFTEMQIDSVSDVLMQMPNLLSDNGVIIIAEPQREYIKRMMRTLSSLANNLGLSIFYPCSELGCNSTGDCWVWRNHSYDFPQMEICGEPLREEPREDLILSWLILSKNKLSVYDVFRIQHPNSIIGPIAQEKTWNSKTRKMNTQYGICVNNTILPFVRDFEISEQYDRGSIVGLSEEGKVVFYHDLS